MKLNQRQNGSEVIRMIFYLHGSVVKDFCLIRTGTIQDKSAFFIVYTHDTVRIAGSLVFQNRFRACTVATVWRSADKSL